MSQLYQCDKCKKNFKGDELLRVIMGYERTSEETVELMKTNPELNFNEVRDKYIVSKVFDLCKKCYEEFKKYYEELKK